MIKKCAMWIDDIIEKTRTVYGPEKPHHSCDGHRGAIRWPINAVLRAAGLIAG
jgi:hypothetical protein